MVDYIGKLESGRVEDVEKIVRRHWKSLMEDPATQDVAREQGVNVDALLELGPDMPLSVEQDSSGNRSDVATAILIGVAVAVGKDVTKAALYAAWDKVIKPNLSGVKEPPPDKAKPSEQTSEKE